MLEAKLTKGAFIPRSDRDRYVIGSGRGHYRPRPLIPTLRQMSIFSAVSIASSTSIARYGTVLSIHDTVVALDSAG